MKKYLLLSIILITVCGCRLQNGKKRLKQNNPTEGQVLSELGRSDSIKIVETKSQEIIPGENEKNEGDDSPKNSSGELLETPLVKLIPFYFENLT